MACNNSCGSNNFGRNTCGNTHHCGCNGSVRNNCPRLANDVSQCLEALYAQADEIKCAFNALEKSNCVKSAPANDCGCGCGCIQPRNCGNSCGCRRSQPVNCPALANDLEDAICELYEQIDAAEAAFDALLDANCIRSNSASPCDDCGCKCPCNRPCPL